MPKLAWDEFIGRHQKPHLLVGELPYAGPPRNERQHVDLLAKFVGRRAKGDYAVTVNRQRGIPEIHCAFERLSDVETVANALDVRSETRNAEGASLRSFRMGIRSLRRLRMDGPIKPQSAKKLQ